MESVCSMCGKPAMISEVLGICRQCCKAGSPHTQRHIREVHAQVRHHYAQQGVPPRDGVSCGLCVNECCIREGSEGYCGVRMNVQGTIMPSTGSPTTAYVECYHDALPTNCVSMDFCAERSTRGTKNLAVFYGSCTFNCLFCQNWQYRFLHASMTVDDLLSHIDEQTACICFFGGDPTPQITHALGVARQTGVRICWETNGAGSQEVAHAMGKTAYESGGTVKIDVKAFSEPLNYALCGSSNKNTLSTCEYLINTFRRKEPPLLVVSTLLIPGYIDEEEVDAIARFLADRDATIPYCLLAFYPHFHMKDLPCTSWEQARRCLKAARSHLDTVKLGNTHLLI
ncbi:MAG: radical SAM protein [Theionarchaea archaeon]|nr:radical SAM protein [Theionarchaea archaeon]